MNLLTNCTICPRKCGINRYKEKGYFAQGTIYPDCIESGKGDAAVIKTHHNKVKIPDDVDFLGIIEPLKDLFKDEVRVVGEKLGIPKELVWRQPFPGPGLGIRIIGEITNEKIKLLQDADFIMTADWAKIPYDILQAVSNRITNECKGINRVVYDITSKPPATVEYE